MENLLLSLEVVLPLFLMLTLGYFLRRIQLVEDGSLRVMNNLVFRVFLPVLLFINIYRTDIGAVMNPRLILFAASCVAGSFLLLFFLIPIFEKDNRRRGVLVQGIFRSNFILFGLPVTIALCGEENSGVTSMVIAVIIPLFNILAVFALEYFRGGKFRPDRVLRGIATNPLIIASLSGVLVLSLGWKLPSIIEKTAEDIAGVATPLALVVLGGSFEFSSVRGRRRQVLAGVFGRLVAVPAVCLPIAAALGFRGPELVTLMALLASPTAVSSFTMAQQMDGDAELAGQLVVFGSLFSILTIFLWTFLLKQLGLI